MNERACDWLCDIWTVLGKEIKDLTHAAAVNPTLRALWLLLFAVFGIALPWWIGPAWLHHPYAALVWLLLPIPLVVGAVAESVAGEREHHTLEPLLATRLPVRAILAGKIAAATAFGWLSAAPAMLAGLVIVNLAAPGPDFHLYPPALAGGTLGLGLLTAGFTAGIGMTVSLHAATVRRACIAMTAAILTIGVLVAGGAVLLYLGGTTRPDRAVTALALLPTPATAALLLTLADLALFGVAGRQFRRGRLLAE